MSTTQVYVFSCAVPLALISHQLQFVYPRINPIRKDVAVMTNQAEIVDIWADAKYH